MKRGRPSQASTFDGAAHPWRPRATSQAAAETDADLLPRCRQKAALSSERHYGGTLRSISMAPSPFTKLAVGQPALASRRVDPGDPELTRKTASWCGGHGRRTDRPSCASLATRNTLRPRGKTNWRGEELSCDGRVPSSTFDAGHGASPCSSMDYGPANGASVPYDPCSSHTPPPHPHRNYPFVRVILLGLGIMANADHNRQFHPDERESASSRAALLVFILGMLVYAGMYGRASANCLQP